MHVLISLGESNFLYTHCYIVYLYTGGTISTIPIMHFIFMCQTLHYTFQFQILFNYSLTYFSPRPSCVRVLLGNTIRWIYVGSRSEFNNISSTFSELKKCSIVVKNPTMSRNRKRAKTAMVAFPVVSGAGSAELQHQNNVFVDYPFLHRSSGFIPSGGVTVILEILYLSQLHTYPWKLFHRRAWA